MNLDELFLPPATKYPSLVSPSVIELPKLWLPELSLMTAAQPLQKIDFLETNMADVQKNLLYGDIDWLHLTVGPEGFGKSQFSYFELCKRVDAGFGVKQIAWSISDFFRIIREIDKPCSAVMLDEGGEILFSLDMMDKQARRVTKALMRARQKHMFICVNATNFEYLNKYIRTSRAKSVALIKAYPDPNTHLLRRGFYSFYSKKRMRGIKVDPKGIHWPAPSFSGRYPFYGGTSEWADYQAAKDAFVDERQVEDAQVLTYKEEAHQLREEFKKHKVEGLPWEKPE